MDFDGKYRTRSGAMVTVSSLTGLTENGMMVMYVNSGNAVMVGWEPVTGKDIGNHPMDLMERVSGTVNENTDRVSSGDQR